MHISNSDAALLLREAATLAESGPINQSWERRVEELSRLCAEAGAATHIAFLGTSILAKATDVDVDLFAIKPAHATDNPKAYSARSLCHAVLVPLSAELGFSIGVTGREPLNNQPYFRMTRLGDGTPVHKASRPAFEFMVGLVSELQRMRRRSDARKALQAFIAVRRRHQRRYQVGEGLISVTPNDLTQAIEQLVTQDSEHGKRAQAAVAGLFDACVGNDRVASGRIHDPSRRYPGDVCIKNLQGDAWEKAIEVRDKPVAVSDVQIFGNKCVAMNVREAAMVMVSPHQNMLDEKTVETWASSLGIGMTLFYDWKTLVQQSLFWSAVPKPDAAIKAAERIEARLLAVEASTRAVEYWHSLVRRT